MGKSIMFFVLLLAGTLGAQPLAIPATAKKAVVFKVHDGDSFELVDSTRRTPAGYLYRFWIRLYAVNAPEVYAKGYSIDQDFGTEAGAIMRSYLKGRTVYYDSLETDVYDNMVARMYLIDTAGIVTDVGAYAVSQGLAWAWVPKWKRKRTDYHHFLVALQEVAESERRGLWALPGRKIRPENWRKKMTGK